MIKNKLLYLSTVIFATSLASSSCVIDKNIDDFKSCSDKLISIEHRLNKALKSNININKLIKSLRVYTNFEDAIYFYSRILYTLKFGIENNRITQQLHDLILHNLLNFTRQIMSNNFYIDPKYKTEIYGYLIYLSKFASMEVRSNLDYRNTQDLILKTPQDESKNSQQLNFVSYSLQKDAMNILKNIKEAKNDPKQIDSWKSIARIYRSQLMKKKQFTHDYSKFFVLKKFIWPQKYKNDEYIDEVKSIRRGIQERARIIEMNRNTSYEGLVNLNYLIPKNIKFNIDNKINSYTLSFDYNDNLNSDDIYINAYTVKKYSSNSDLLLIRIKYMPQLMNFQEFLAYQDKYVYSHNYNDPINKNVSV
ncbi:hypothetical protein [Mycoplasma simbae]|uniref:hypothetical protein n=1 Tax=Mycoplasma simbae TaxID=36744 RepID=UPI0004974297|nr:hypothetical protein [Mycoplasma simbae]